MIDNLDKEARETLIKENAKMQDTASADIEQTGAGYDDDAPTQVSITHTDPNRSNMNLEINMRLNFSYFPRPNVLIKVLNKNYSEIQKAPLSSNQGIKLLDNYITKYLNGMTIFCHNAHNFDIPRINNYLYKNLKNPWPFSKRNNINVIDTTYLFKALMAYNRDFIVKKENNDYTYKLEYISKKFKGSDFVQSHDSTQDNLNLISNISEANKLNNNFFKIVSEQFSAEDRLIVLEKNSIVAVTTFSKHTGADLKLFLPLYNSSWRNYFYLIKIDEDDPFDEDIESLVKNFSDVKRIKDQKLSQFDIFWTPESSTFKDRFSYWPIQKISEVIRRIRSSETFRIEIENHKDKKYGNNKKDIGQLGCYYSKSGFYSKKDDVLCNYFNSSPPQIKNELINNFEDEGLKHNAQVLMFNEFPSYLRPSLRDEIFESERDKFIKGNASRVSLEDCKESFEELKSGYLNHREQEILKNYEQTIVAFEKQPEKFYGGFNEN